MKGVNDHEIPAFHDFATGTGIEVRFLEMMRIGPARAMNEKHFLSTASIVQALEAHVGLLDDLPAAADSTVFRKRSRAGAFLGFMGSETGAFCGTCSRLRLSARGILHPCLFREDGVDLRGATEGEIRERVRAVAPLKPMDRIHDIARPMHRIGG
jgi:cyclic pyranopterin phosphate synthase